MLFVAYKLKQKATFQITVLHKFCEYIDKTGFIIAWARQVQCKLVELKDSHNE